jgi:hypothetical protein
MKVGRRRSGARQADRAGRVTMIRSIAWAAVVGALVAAGGYTRPSAPHGEARLQLWLAPPERTVEAKLTPEEWTICTTMGAMGSEADWAQLDPDFAAGKKALVAEDWNGAIAA